LEAIEFFPKKYTTVIIEQTKILLTNRNVDA